MDRSRFGQCGEIPSGPKHFFFSERQRVEPLAKSIRGNFPEPEKPAHKGQIFFPSDDELHCREIVWIESEDIVKSLHGDKPALPSRRQAFHNRRMEDIGMVAFLCAEKAPLPESFRQIRRNILIDWIQQQIGIISIFEKAAKLRE